MVRDRDSYWLNIYKNNALHQQENTTATDYMNYMVYFLFYFYTQGISDACRTCSVNNKFFDLKRNIMENMFIREDVKDAFLYIFSRAQKTYMAFSKLASIYKYNKATIKINTDLCMNDIFPNQRYVYTLMQDNSKYLFIISDLIKILNTGLSNAPCFFVEPYIAKNPYNNIRFNHSTIYNIYFFIKNLNMIMPPLLEAFYKSKLNTSIFVQEYESLIKTVAIKNYAFSSPYTMLKMDIWSMFQVNAECTKQIHIHKDFPKDKLVDIMRPYLHLFYIYRYYIHGTEKRNNAYNILFHKLESFIQYNPYFGRKKMKLENRTKINGKMKFKWVVTFNMKHIPFHEKMVVRRIVFSDSSDESSDTDTNMDVDMEMESEYESESEI